MSIITTDPATLTKTLGQSWQGSDGVMMIGVMVWHKKTLTGADRSIRQ